MNISDDFCRHQLTAMMVQKTHIQGHGTYKVEFSSGEKLHQDFPGHKYK